MVIAHLSDLHLRDASDATWLDRQLDRIAARAPDHLAITGDVLDRWIPRLLDRVLDALAARALLDPERLTILHGNHDLASSGGHPRRGADLWRLALRSWDPPPLTAWRRRRFYEQIERRAPGVAAAAPFAKRLASGAQVAVIDTVPFPWLPVRMRDGHLVVQHAIGCVRPAQVRWLAGLRDPSAPLVVLMHHYPLDTPQFQWSPQPGSRLRVRGVNVPMHIPERNRELLWRGLTEAGTALVLCGHVHRARLVVNQDVAVGLNGQSGAAWAGRTTAWYEVGDGVQMKTEALPAM